MGNESSCTREGGRCFDDYDCQYMQCYRDICEGYRNISRNSRYDNDCDRENHMETSDWIIGAVCLSIFGIAVLIFMW